MVILVALVSRDFSVCFLFKESTLEAPTMKLDYTVLKTEFLCLL